jgi:H+/Cl- antiporter ClcA
MNEDGPFLRLVVLVGVASGLTGAAYIGVLKVVTRLLGPDQWSDSGHLVVLAAVGAIVGGLSLVLGSPGDVELMVDNIHVSGGRSDLRDLRTLLPVSLLGIGAGSAVGPEAPLVQTTGSIGSWLAQRHHLDIDELRILTITGMAAGFTVLFGAPLGGALFALEILHRRGLQYYEALLPSAVGALSGYAVYTVVRGAGLAPIWSFPSPHQLRPVDLLVGLGAGVAGAAVAVVFTYTTVALRWCFHRLPALARPITGGLALGGLAFLSPYALTFGEGQIGTLLVTRLGLGALVLAAACKLVAAATMVSSGWRGGFIIPLFFLGVVLGTIVSRELHTDRIVTMLAMMAACNVGVTKTPFGSTLVVAGMAGVVVLPTTLIAAIVALLLTSRVALIETQRERDPVLGGAIS